MRTAAPAGTAAAIGDVPADHFTAGVGSRCAARIASSAGDAPAAPKPTKTVSGPPCAAARVSPPKYAEAGLDAAAVLPSLPRDDARRRSSALGSMPEPSTATLPAVKAEAANACTSSAETGAWVWAGAKSELPSPVRKASAWASSSACVAGSASAAVASASHVGATHSESS